MEKSKEFQGKTLDSAIKSACEYFNVPREKLEIEIVNDAKAGIFGLVGAKKARILARKTMLATAASVLSGQVAGDIQAKYTAPVRDVVRESKRLESLTEEKGGSRAQEPQLAPKKEPRRAESGEITGAGQKRRPFVRGMSKQTAYSAAKGPFRQSRSLLSSENSKKTDTSENGSPIGSEHLAKERIGLHESFTGLPLEDEGEAAFEGLSIVPLEQLDVEKLRVETQAAVQRIVAAIVQDARYVVRIEDGRVTVSVETNEDSGLLIGREGQTLSSIQYLVSRIVSKAMGAFIPLQVDAGDYRERQDEKLREMARQLARRVHETGRPHSTRPLSSYHRRVVHMALQDDTEIQTRSKGEGQLKRVILFRKSGKPGGCDCK